MFMGVISQLNSIAHQVLLPMQKEQDRTKALRLDQAIQHPQGQTVV